MRRPPHRRGVHVGLRRGGVLSAIIALLLAGCGGAGHSRSRSSAELASIPPAILVDRPPLRDLVSGAVNLRALGWPVDRHAVSVLPDPSLLIVERADYLVSVIILRRESSKSLPRSLTNFRGIRAEETGSVHHSPVHDRVVLADMVPLETVSPGSVLLRVAEDRYVIILGVAPGSGSAKAAPADGNAGAAPANANGGTQAAPVPGSLADRDEPDEIDVVKVPYHEAHPKSAFIA